MRAIYIDNKIKGAIKQLINYFIEGVFDKKNTKVIFKYYKESFEFYKKELEKHSISYIYYKNINSLDLSGYKVIFYLFNAQSNCRIVNFRDAKHIFVTHGESNKLASIKPIIRIYDYIVCAGDAGIHRYIENGIFTHYDAQTNRIIKLGDTFIGKSRYKKAEDKKNSYLLYAPTWEGGIVSESYSSLSADLNSFKIIKEFAKANDIENIVIQAHPNTGHRDKKFNEYLENGIKLLKDNFLKVESVNTKIDKKNFFTTFLKKEKDININEKTYPIYRAFIDVSAMETQLLNENIDTNIFINNMQNAIVKNQLLEKYYETISIKELDKKPKVVNYLENIKDYYIGYSFEKLKDMTKNQRVEWLVEFTKEKRKET